MHEFTTGQLGRRRFLTAAALTLAPLTGATQLLSGATPAAAADDAYDTLRTTWGAILTGGPIDPSGAGYPTALSALSTTATGLWTSLSANASANSLWPGLTLSVPANMTASYKQLATMATAYATPGTAATDGTGRALYANNELGAAVVAGLDFLHTQVYNAGATESGNWWEWEIGSPVALTNAAILVHPLLTTAQLADWTAAIDHFVPDPTLNRYGTARTTSTGANRVDLCQVVAVRGILGKSSERLTTAAAALSDVYPYVTTGDGLYADGSFVQHTDIAYTGTYGMVLLRGLTLLFQLLDGSDWDITDPAAANIHDSVDSAFAPWVWNGLCMDAVRGRAVSRYSETDFYDGNLITQAVLRAAISAPTTAQTTRFRSLAKGWITRGDAYAPFTSTAGVAGIALARPVLDDSSLTAAAEPVGHVQFPSMDRAVHRGDGWAFALAMSSARIARYEAINGENLHGWHTGDGMGYLYLASDLGHYTDGYWPTVDPYRLPGTTVDTLGLADSAGTGTRPAATWVGGASLAGRYGTVGMDFRQYGSTLTAKKSWFCLDDSVVCLGAGITGGSGADVVTVVENRNLGADGDHTLTVDGTAQPATTGWSNTLDVSGWAHLKDVGGYLFPGGATVQAARTARTGAWRDINTGGTTDVITRRYASLCLSHGTAPSAESYSYVLLPGFSAARTAARAASPTVTVLANTASVQAVRDSSLGLTAANFFSAGSAGGITVSAPCSVIMRQRGGRLVIGVSDPSRAASTITVQLVLGGALVSADSGITVTQSSPTITLTVDVSGAAGATREATFKVTSATLTPTADTYVRDGSYADTNHGTATTLVVKNATGSGFTRQAYLTFDTSCVFGPVTAATLSARGFVSDSGGTSATVSAYAVADSSWSESGLTWNTRPTLGAALSSATATTTKSTLTFDVTRHVAARARTRQPVSLALAETAPGLAVVLDSRENRTSPPVLYLDLAGT
ncbi:polysaccharide lyase family 8 super-sandwich domain-containing protein [Streptomyces sp. CL12-4]|uniref:polysaccharide lyase family 8 super-sandwich domain-containing protein n=1 Tax=Streptomyces sp. CL12-4 TaxID=2810306 RepID=UPI001EFBF3F8|nr:polysaccharide lyase family 8 super-sandwich domain-containing protein [Streptomyces sp. CL12-4]MCG8970285.1 polysaccharide lyase 8 family protein [Streptomyces sp. CL12-4]